MDELDRLAELWYRKNRDRFPDQSDEQVSEMAYMAIEKEQSDLHAARRGGDFSGAGGKGERFQVDAQGKPVPSPTSPYTATVKAVGRGLVDPYAQLIDNLTKIPGAMGGPDVGTNIAPFISEKFGSDYGAGSSTGEMGDLRFADVLGETAGNMVGGGKLFGSLGKLGGAMMGKMFPNAAKAIAQGSSAVGQGAAQLAGKAGMGPAGQAGLQAGIEALPGQIGTTALFNASQGNTNPGEAAGFGILGALTHGLGAARTATPRGPVAPQPGPSMPLDPLAILQEAQGSMPISKTGAAYDRPFAEQAAKAGDPRGESVIRLAPDPAEGPSAADVQAASVLRNKGKIGKTPKKQTKADAVLNEVREKVNGPLRPEVIASTEKVVALSKGKGKVAKVPKGQPRDLMGGFEVSTEPPKAVLEKSKSAPKAVNNMSEESATHLLRDTGRLAKGFMKVRLKDGKMVARIDPSFKEGGAASEPAKPFRRKPKE